MHGFFEHEHDALGIDQNSSTGSIRGILGWQTLQRRAMLLIAWASKARQEASAKMDGLWEAFTLATQNTTQAIKQSLTWEPHIDQ
jgi:hypothetical protein